MNDSEMQVKRRWVSSRVRHCPSDGDGFVSSRWIASVLIEHCIGGTHSDLAFRYSFILKSKRTGDSDPFFGQDVDLTFKVKSRGQ